MSEPRGINRPRVAEQWRATLDDSGQTGTVLLTWVSACGTVVEGNVIHKGKTLETKKPLALSRLIERLL